ncbi:MAG: hypothetical protein ACUVTP_05925 [Candidatus Fervidibacter sp.]|uniref:hypothetical protein n=1 Tax=Candidatus Fervidibacter sp. TaxID=3100871 RepID=UPI00404B03C8
MGKPAATDVGVYWQPERGKEAERQEVASSEIATASPATPMPREEAKSGGSEPSFLFIRPAWLGQWVAVSVLGVLILILQRWFA